VVCVPKARRAPPPPWSALAQEGGLPRFAEQPASLGSLSEISEGVRVPRDMTQEGGLPRFAEQPRLHGLRPPRAHEGPLRDVPYSGALHRARRSP
jgi:hypothetical protein